MENKMVTKKKNSIDLLEDSTNSMHEVHSLLKIVKHWFNDAYNLSFKPLTGAEKSVIINKYLIQSNEMLVLLSTIEEKLEFSIGTVSEVTGVMIDEERAVCTSPQR